MLPKTILDRFWGQFLNDLEAFWGGFWDQSGVHFEMIFATKLDRNCWVPWGIAIEIE